MQENNAFVSFPCVARDVNMHTALVLSKGRKKYSVIVLVEYRHGKAVQHVPFSEFERAFQPIALDPVDVARKYLQFGEAPGLTVNQGAEQALRSIIKESEMKSFDVASANAAELVEFYNAHAPKPVKRFATRADGMRRCQALIDAASSSKPATQPQQPKETEMAKPKKATKGNSRKPAKASKPAKVSKPAKASKPAASRSEGVSNSWKDPKVAAARSAKHKVKVGGQVYSSTWTAFQALKLDPKKCLKFRAHLKEAGAATFEGHRFTLVQPEAK